MRKFNQPTSGGNPFGNFNAITTNNMPNNNINNFNTAFAINQPFIEKMDFRNKNNLLQNNVNENTMLEQINEYYLNIDSIDRSIQAYPNPFNYTVTFGGIGATKDKKMYQKRNFDINGTMNENKFDILSLNKNGELRDNSKLKPFQKGIMYEGTPGPIINRKFKNVKYLRIDYIILPVTNILSDALIASPSSSDCGCNNNESCLSMKDEHKLSYRYKYLILRINEIRSDKILGTNKNLESDTFILYPDKIMGANHIMWLPTNGTRTYKNSILENLNKLTFEILTPKGDQIAILDNQFNEVNINNIETEKLYNCVEENMQTTISIVLGVVENELNTNTKFDY